MMTFESSANGLRNSYSMYYIIISVTPSSSAPVLTPKIRSSIFVICIYFSVVSVSFDYFDPIFSSATTKYQTGVPKVRSMTRYQNHDDDASRRKRSKTFDDSVLAPWSNLNHDVLFLVMMQLGFADFLAFSEVCKSWRSCALTNRNTFMASKPPVSLLISRWASEDDWFHLEDFERKELKTLIPHSAGRKCVGSTCGYLILYGEETHDFLLVNLITKHELYFSAIPSCVGAISERIKGVLVFSPSTSGWLFVVLHNTLLSNSERKTSFYIVSKQECNYVSSTLPILDLCFFKGKIYTLHNDSSLSELRLSLKQKRKWILLKTMNFSNAPCSLYTRLVSSGENLYMFYKSIAFQKVLQLDIGEMKWVLPEKSIEEYAFFISEFNYSAAVKPKSWADPRTQYECYGYLRYADERRQHMRVYYKQIWYFFHDCLNVNLLDDS